MSAADERIAATAPGARQGRMHRIIETRTTDSVNMPTAKKTASSQAAPAEAWPAAPGKFHALLIAAPGAVLVLAVYVWFVSIGAWVSWPLGGSYYDQLANAFRDGHLWLERTPSPQLLALPNPYDPAARAGVSFISDASLYNGRYYLYFGPMPGLLVAGFKFISPVLIGDQSLVFVFTAGTFIVLVAFVVRLWRRFFPATPRWLVASTLVGVGLISPFTWILGSNASVHDTAIASGQFFLLLGLLAAWIALDRAAVSKRLAVLAGIFWAASLGSRITLIVPIGIVAVLLGAHVVRKGSGLSRGETVSVLLAFFAPVVAGLGALAWYNWARFDSLLETGISYQLALLYIQAQRSKLFSIRYLIQNAYNYVLMPPKVRYNFPYVWPQMGMRHPILPGLSLPSL